MTKAKRHGGARDLFAVLRTPDVLRRVEVANLSSFADSPRKPSILKHSTMDDSESDRVSESSKLKVSFAMEGERPKTPTKRQTTFVTMEEGSQSDMALDDDSSSMADQSEIDPQEMDPSATPRRK